MTVPQHSMVRGKFLGTKQVLRYGVEVHVCRSIQTAATVSGIDATYTVVLVSRRSMMKSKQIRFHQG
jgi:hypothetical protein